MASGKKPDPRRKKTHAPHSTYMKVENGKKIGAWMAGELYGCYAHRTYATQPCIANITDDALPCPLCAGGLIPEWRGYVPLWDVDWTLKHVLINEEYYESVNAIPFRAKVSVSRAKNPISPLVVREEVMLTRELPAGSPWTCPVVMLPICLTLWKQPELTRWCEANRLLAMGPQCAEPAAPSKPIKMPAPAVKKTGKPYTAPNKDGAELVNIPAIAERLKAVAMKGETSTNGKHKAEE